MDPLEACAAFHERTKHYPHRFARSPGRLDWHTQPDPFRRYEGAPLVRLPLMRRDDSPPFAALGAAAIPPRPMGLASLACFLEHALAISAWKEFQGDRWALRCNPSSGNLHPTEGYLITPAVPGLCDIPAVFHYAPREHGLEQRASFPDPVWRELAGQLPAESFLLGFTSIHWREAWKYGERAYRYCQHDLGHALAASSYAAALLGWRVMHLDGLGDADCAALLGVDRQDGFDKHEREHPGLVAVVCPAPGPFECPRAVPHAAVSAVAAGDWRGRPNRLSPGHVRWPAIDKAADTCHKEPAQLPPRALPAEPSPGTPAPSGAGPTAREVILRRRSAAAMDGTTSMPRAAFNRMLARLLPHTGGPPWAALAPPPAVHPVLFVHRVDGLDPGLYCLPRTREAGAALRDALDFSFAWDIPPECPAGLPLRLLRPGRFDAMAAKLSCGQEIAGGGVFCLAMLARFEEPIAQHGAWYYRRLFWEAGMLGQVLYLEAEAAGLRGTGIGCFFDDDVHSALALKGRRYQCIYLFTVGGALDDARLTTRPPYSARRPAPSPPKR
ncbi:MAG: hypothetical protein JXR94_02330 [Candidatus Hydrogenedentes bacterium]|nr:hypothetical protein [Candidatus Hydrogenedentota bacterium]